MNERERSYLAFGLAALAIVCATVLAGLRVIDAKDWAIAVAGAFAAVGLYHAPSPFRGGAAPPVALLVLLGLCACQAQVEVGYHDRPLARGTVEPLAVGLNGDFVRLAALGSAPTELSGKPGLYAGADGVLRFKAAGGATLKAGESTGPTVSAGAPGGAALGSCWADSTDDYRVYCRESSGDLAQRVDLSRPGIIGGGTPSSATFTSIAMASSGKITGLGTPTQSADAATKAYVDSAAGGAVTFSSVKSALAAADSSIGVNSQKITGLGQGTASGQALHAGRSVSTTAGQLTGGGALTSDLTLGLATAGTAGTYAWPSSVTTDAYGRATGVTAGTCPQNQVLAGPVAGGSGAVACRALDTADLPGGGASLPGLFWDPVDVGGFVGWSGIAGNYVWGTGWQALKALTVTGVKARTQETSGTLTLSVWVGGVRVRTGTATITAAGVYTVTFGSSLSVSAGTNFTASAYTSSGTIPYIDASAAELEVVVAGPKVRLKNGRLYATGDIEPTNTSSAFLFGVSPVIE